MLLPPHAPVTLLAPAVGVSAGASYRWGNYLPGRLNRPIAEVNLGLREALHFDDAGHTGGNPYVTILDEGCGGPSSGSC